MSNERSYQSDATMAIMGELSQIFDNYYLELENMDKIIDENFSGGGSDGALASLLGIKVLVNWSANSKRFDDFRGKFTEFYDKVSAINTNNLNTQETATNAIYGVGANAAAGVAIGPGTVAAEAGGNGNPNSPGGNTGEA